MSESIVSTKELREELENLLGVYFYELHGFFREILVSNYDCVVFLARRCLVLYRLYQKLFESEPEESLEVHRVYQENCILSDKAIGQISKQKNNAKILIVDDVLIHGNHLWNVYQEIITILPDSDITPRVYMRSECCPSPSVPNEFWDKLTWQNTSRNGQWMELSDRIVSAIYYSNVPYISYLGAYHVEKNIDFIQNCPNLEVIDSTNLGQKRVGCRSRVLFCENQRPPFLKTVSALDCIRVYESPADNCYMVIPYSFTKALRKDTSQEFFEKLATQLPPSMVHIREQFMKAHADNSSVWELYRHRLFKALISYIFGLCFFRSRQQSHEIETFDLELGFDAKTAEELRGISYASILPLLEQGSEIWGGFFSETYQENGFFVNKLEDIRKQGLNCDTYWDYIRFHRAYEESRVAEANVKDYKGKLPGLSIDYVLRREENLESRRTVATQILSLNDSGCATSTFALSEDGEVYTSFLSNGEQSFRILFERYPFIIRKMIYLEEMAQDVYEYLNALFDWMRKWKAMHTGGQQNIDNIDLDKMEAELTAFYEEKRGELPAQNVVSILEDPIYWKAENITPLRAFHKKYFSVE